MNHSLYVNLQTHGLKWLLLASALLVSNAALAASKEWHFEVLLDDKKIGHHSFHVKKQGESHILESQAEFNVKFLFFTAYSYKHQNLETWKGNCLNSITSSTDDNGKPYSVRGMRQDDRFIVMTGSERSTLPPCPMTFAYWNPEILDEARLLNSQTGEYLPVQIRDLGEDPIEINRQTVRANRYQIEAKNIYIELWYSKRGEWLALQSKTESGKTLKYRLVDGTSIAKQRIPDLGGAS